MPLATERAEPSVAEALEPDRFICKVPSCGAAPEKNTVPLLPLKLLEKLRVEAEVPVKVLVLLLPVIIPAIVNVLAPMLSVPVVHFNPLVVPLTVVEVPKVTVPVELIIKLLTV